MNDYDGLRECEVNEWSAVGLSGIPIGRGRCSLVVTAGRREDGRIRGTGLQ